MRKKKVNPKIPDIEAAKSERKNLMTEETKNKLKAAGREDLIEAHEITQEGYAGILPNGNIVDRRKHPEAIPVQENGMLGVPKPKQLGS